MNHLLTRRNSFSSLRGKQPEASSITPSSTTPSDQKPREAKSAPDTRPSYVTVLTTKGSFIDKSDLGITVARASAEFTGEKANPQDPLFRDDIFDKACQKDTRQERGKGSSRYHSIDRPFCGNPSYI